MPSTCGIQLENSSRTVFSTMAETECLSSQGKFVPFTREADTVFSHLYQSTEPEKEISIWLDEKEQQHSKRQQLNDSVSNLTDGCVSPLQSTLNTEWDDISSTQRKYYARKAGEIFAGTLSVLCPGQEEALWESIRRDPLLKSDGGTEGTKRKYFDDISELIDALIEAHN